MHLATVLRKNIAFRFPITGLHFLNYDVVIFFHTESDKLHQNTVFLLSMTIPGTVLSQESFLKPFLCSVCKRSVMLSKSILTVGFESQFYCMLFLFQGSGPRVLMVQTLILLIAQTKRISW